MPRVDLGARRPLTRFSTVLVAIGLSLSIVTMTPRPAEAFTNPVPVVMGGAKVAAPLRILTSATPAGLAVNGIGMLAVAAWETRDSWLPIAKNLWGGLTQSGSPIGGTTQPVAAYQFVRTEAQPHEFSFWVNSLDGSNADRSGTIYSVRCYTPGTGAPPREIIGSQTTGSNIFVFTRYTTGLVNPQLRSYTYCPAGSVVLSIDLTVGGTRHKVHFGWKGGKPEYGTITTNVECIKPDGTKFTLTGSMPAGGGQVPVPSCRAAGGIPNRIDTSTDQSGKSESMFSAETDPGWLTQYGDCLRGATGPVCRVAVWIGGEPCTMGDLACVDWMDYAVRYPQRVECRLGSTVIAFAMCDVLKHSYVATPHTVTTPGPNGEPEIKPPGQPNPDPDPDPDPNDPNNPPNPPSNCVPGEPKCPIPPPPPIDPDTVDPDSTGCLGEAWSLNPVDWVYVPVKCAFVWAFVPKTPMSERVGRVEDSFTDKAPFVWFAQLLDLPAAIGGGPAVAARTTAEGSTFDGGTSIGGGCPDWRIKVGDLVDKNVVCDSSFTAAIRGARPFLLAGMLAVAFWPLLRGLMFASVPILKPIPTGGDKS